MVTLSEIGSSPLRRDFCLEMLSALSLIETIWTCMCFCAFAIILPCTILLDSYISCIAKLCNRYPQLLDHIDRIHCCSGIASVILLIVTFMYCDSQSALPVQDIVGTFHICITPSWPVIAKAFAQAIAALTICVLFAMFKAVYLLLFFTTVSPLLTISWFLVSCWFWFRSDRFYPA